MKPTIFSICETVAGRSGRVRKLDGMDGSYSWGSYTPKPVLPKLSRAIAESVKRYRKLADRNPAKSPRAVAMALEWRGGPTIIPSVLTEAESAYDEALKIPRKLAKENPLVRMELAGVLTRVGVLYAATLRRNEAERAYNEALAIRRQLDPSHSACSKAWRIHCTISASCFTSWAVGMYPKKRYGKRSKFAANWPKSIRRSDVPHLAARHREVPELFTETRSGRMTPTRRLRRPRRFYERPLSPSLIRP